MLGAITRSFSHKSVSCDMCGKTEVELVSFAFLSMPELLLFACLAIPPWWLGDPSYVGAMRKALASSTQVRGTEAYFDSQLLDHMAPNDIRLLHTWSQRYFEDLSLWRGPGYPVFLALGGEGPEYGAPDGLQRELAEQHGAALITLEHRFYGKSRPTANMSATNLRYLSSELALADATTFIQWWGEQHASTTSSWIAWGGSYSGQLAAWLRLRYPTSVIGSVAYSAPVLSKFDFWEYDAVCTNVLTARAPVVLLESSATPRAV